jgi:hypothetical protein
MTMFLGDDVKIIFGVFAMIWFALVFMAKRRPDIAWLQHFRIPELSPARQARQRRRAEILSGLQFILLGIVLPLGYGAITIMMFNDFDPWWTAGVLITSAVFIAIGVVAIAKNVRG